MQAPRLYELHAVRGAGREQSDATCERVGLWNEPSRSFRVWLECIQVEGEHRGASVRWSAGRLDELETLAGVPIQRVRLLERVAADDYLVSLLPQGTAADDLVVEVELSSALPPAFTPYERYPRCTAEVSFDDVLEKLTTAGPVRISGVHEAERYWAFGRWQIGSCGCAVERADGRVTDFGSAYAWDDWIWGYERGLVRDDRVDLVVESVLDVELAVALLDTLRIGGCVDNRRRLAAPPVVFPTALNWVAIRELRHRGEAAFTWSVR